MCFGGSEVIEEKSQMVRKSGGCGGQGPTPRVAVDLMDSNEKNQRKLPVWFFVGVILLIYGVLIFLTGIYELPHPPSTVLGDLHPAIWWGALLLVIGAIYVYLFRPRKPSSRSE